MATIVTRKASIELARSPRLACSVQDVVRILRELSVRHWWRCRTRIRPWCNGRGGVRDQHGVVLSIQRMRAGDVVATGVAQVAVSLVGRQAVRAAKLPARVAQDDLTHYRRSELIHFGGNWRRRLLGERTAVPL